jgi:hypothetical protein
VVLPTIAMARKPKMLHGCLNLDEYVFQGSLDAIKEKIEELIALHGPLASINMWNTGYESGELRVELHYSRPMTKEEIAADKQKRLETAAAVALHKQQKEAHDAVEQMVRRNPEALARFVQMVNTFEDAVNNDDS